MIKLYDFPLSGHSHRARLMLSLLQVEYQTVHVKLDQGEHHETFFSNLNPFQQVPVLDDNGIIIRESIAIICYLATKYDHKWYPQDPLSVARVQEWLAIANKELSTGPAAARLVNVFGADLDQASLIEQSHALFKIIDKHLNGRTWLALDQISVADIAAYSYIAHAPEGGVALTAYTHINSWLSKIEALPNFIAMQKTPIKKAS